MMRQTAIPNVEELRASIGRTEAARDTLTPRLARELSATLGGSDALPALGAPAPYGAHWCLAPAIAAAGSLGADGHPTRGGFLPPVPLPRRMWAASSLQFHDGLLVGDDVERRSRIADVVLKHGRTGTLCFVTLEHQIFSARGLAVSERQDVVYRELAPPPADSKPPIAYDGPAPEWRQELRADPVLLFRYSAITFNGHRIHYDRDYAMRQEFYPGLVVHGPLQATLLLGFAAGVLGRHPKQFSFRGVSPLFDFQGFALAARRHGEALSLWVQNEDDVQTMTGEAA
jgi:3-methylfumaryl-CoA hydratase